MVRARSSVAGEWEPIPEVSAITRGRDGGRGRAGAQTRAHTVIPARAEQQKLLKTVLELLRLTH